MQMVILLFLLQQPVLLVLLNMMVQLLKVVPIESILPGANQIQTNEKAGLTFMNEDGFYALMDAIHSPSEQAQVITFFLVAYLITFVRSVHKKFGTRVFWNTLLGKSQEPLEENLIFMFIDLRHSTALAEELAYTSGRVTPSDLSLLLSDTRARAR